MTDNAFYVGYALDNDFKAWRPGGRGNGAATWQGSEHGTDSREHLRPCCR